MITISTESIICIQYSVVSLICSLSLIYCIVVTDRSAEHSDELLFYKLAMGFAVLCSLNDIVYALRQYGAFRLGRGADYLSEILYSLGSICGAFCWFVYSEKKQLSPAVRSPGLVKLFAVPFAVMSLFTVTTPFHGLCFSLKGTQYVRGVLNVPFTGLCSAFLVITGIHAFINSFRKKYHSRAALLKLLFLYAVVLIAAQVMQVLIGPILPFRSLFASSVFLFVTLRGMCETVTVDALSRVNNRFSLDRVLDSWLSGSEPFWLILLDIDDFKHINDTYGHIRGDEAIRRTASAIQRAVPSHYFVARYGGDEFAVVAPYEEESAIAALEEKINAELHDPAREDGCFFPIDITAGYAARNKSISNIPDMVEAADRMLYEKKRGKKALASKKGQG